MNKVGYILEQIPSVKESFIATEIEAMQRCGHQVQAFVLQSSSLTHWQQQLEMQKSAVYLSNYGDKFALSALIKLQPKLFKILAIAVKQQVMSVQKLLIEGLKLAHVVEQQRCSHLHAYQSQYAVFIAIVAARICGISVSFSGCDDDICQPANDLAIRLNAADFAVADCLDMAWYFQNIAPEANTSLIYRGIDCSERRGSTRHSRRAARSDRSGACLHPGFHSS